MSPPADPDPGDVRTLEGRLRQMCLRGDRADAVTLAKAYLHGTDDVTVAVDESVVTVETGQFRGTHEWYRTSTGRFVVSQQGEYIYDPEGVDLSFSTATMNDVAHDRAVAELEARLDDRDAEARPNGGDHSTSTDDDRSEPAKEQPERNREPSLFDRVRDLFGR